MADYREISQQYAQGAIKAVFVLNGGAAVAMLTQLASLINLKLGSAAYWPVAMWAIGTAFAAAAWVPAFLSARYVDKHIQEKSDKHLITSNTYMNWGLVLIVASLACFVLATFVLAYNLP